MARRFMVRTLAEADIESAAQWYDRQRPGLAERFLTDLERTFTRIRERPLQFPAIVGDVRRALLHIFPYAVYFQASEDVLNILAVLHLRRHSRAWQRREP